MHTRALSVFKTAYFSQNGNENNCKNLMGTRGLRLLSRNQVYAVFRYDTTLFLKYIFYYRRKFIFSSSFYSEAERHELQARFLRCHRQPGDLTVSKSPGTSYQIKIHFSIKTTKFLVKYNVIVFKFLTDL